MKLLKFFVKNNDLQRELGVDYAEYGPHHRPSAQIIRNVVKKYELEFTLLGNSRSNRARNMTNAMLKL